jgi:lipoprotein-releasing system permease protein
VTVKGVDDNYRELVDVESILCGDGEYVLNYDILDFGIFGIGVLHNHFGVDIWYDTPVKMYAPRKGERIDLNDPLESFNEGELFCPNVSFESKQGKYDSNYVITSLDFAQKLFEKEGRVTSVELKIAEGVDIDDAEEKIQAQLGDDFIVKNRYEQQEDTFRIMEIEKLISYIFLTFVLVVASFNIISSLSMLIIDKKQDIKTLRNLGASDSQIATIFMIEGRMISLIGAVIGIVLGLSLCLLQQYFGFVKLGSSSESYIIEAYPVKVEILDILVTFVTVLVIGFISVWYPVKRLSKR